MTVIHLALLVLLSWIFYRKVEMNVRHLYWPALLVRCLGGLALGYVYWQYYADGDTFYLFELAREKASIFGENPSRFFSFLWNSADPEWKGVARSLFFVKLLTLPALLTGGNYWITSLWFSWFSFLCAFSLVRLLVQMIPDTRLAAAVAFLFFPSVVFWGSGVIKESLALAGLLLLAGLFLRQMLNQRLRLADWLLGAMGVWLVWHLKYYWIAVFLPTMITSVIVHQVSDRFHIPSKMKLPIWLMLFALFCLTAGLAHPNFKPDRFLRVVVESHDAFVSISSPDDLIVYHGLQPTWQSMLIHAPWALVSGLFRPWVGEASNLLQRLAGVENGVVLILTLAALWRFREFLNTPYRLIVISVAGYVIILCIFLALSTPNLGTLSRYKVGFEPFLIFIIVHHNPMVSKIFEHPLMSYLKSKIG